MVMHVCRREGEIRPCLSFVIGKDVVSFKVELKRRCFVLADYPTAYRGEEGSLWVLMPKGFFVWNSELRCEVKPSMGRRFYLSTDTQDPFHLLMEW